MKKFFYERMAMKKCSVQLFITIFIILILAGMSGREASAYKVRIKTEKTGPYAEKMGDEMFEVAKEGASRRFKSDWKEAKEDGDANSRRVFVGMDVKKKDTFILCKPYVCWSDRESIALYPSYIFPVVVKGKIVALLEVFGRMDEPEYVSADILTNYTGYEEEIERLNELDYLHKDYVFFYYEDTKMAQGEDGKIVKLFDDADTNREPTDGEKFFYALDYDKKLELTIAQMDDYMTHEELMALHEKNFDPNPIIGGTDSGGEAAPAPQQTTSTPKPDTPVEENSDNSNRLLPGVAVSVIVTVLVTVLIIVRIKKLRFCHILKDKADR